MIKTIAELREEASRYRQMADAEPDVRAASKLLDRAYELDSRAAALEAELRLRAAE